MDVLKTLKPGRPQGIFDPYMENISPYMEQNDDVRVVCSTIIITVPCGYNIAQSTSVVSYDHLHLRC